MCHNSHIYITPYNHLKINHLQMKVLEIFIEKLRNKLHKEKEQTIFDV